MKKAFVFAQMLIMLMVLHCPARAGDTDPAGEQLRAIRENYLKTAPPGDETAEKLRMVEGANYKDWIPWLCSFETVVGIGAVIWGNRMEQDNCKPSSIHNPTEYCCAYSFFFDHWTWDPDNFKDSVFEIECTR